MFKTSIAALARYTHLVVHLRNVNLEATGSYPDGAYSSGGVEAVVGYEGTTESGIGWYVGETLALTQKALTISEM